MPSGPRSTPTCWADITRVIMRMTSSPESHTAGGADSHPLLAGVSTPFDGQARCTRRARWRPRTRSPVDGNDSRPSGRTGGLGQPRGDARGVFYTSLGHPDDFTNPSFRRLLRNAVFWAMNREPADSQ